ncbi:MAG: DinB superfamily protein [Ignavibacteriae bacterium HGW-Ignavibacteriae-3]|nr:MAG: DinB superfamily protein [Ignavibacteriae bacterium HGW-Ignavibacteriae-3]
MTFETLSHFFERDLVKIIEELKLYAQEKDMWAAKAGISNSAGNLALHIIGNLNHFIGFTLGNTGYIRDRDAEFNTPSVPRSDLIAGLKDTIAVLNKSLSAMSVEDGEKPFPLAKHGETVTTNYMFLHLLTHLNYHLGQINYHRRLLTGDMQ